MALLNASFISSSSDRWPVMLYVTKGIYKESFKKQYFGLLSIHVSASIMCNWGINAAFIELNDLNWSKNFLYKITTGQNDIVSLLAEKAPSQ